MIDKDAAAITALAELGMYDDEPLDDDQLEMLQRALNPDDFFLDDVENLFKGTD